MDPEITWICWAKHLQVGDEVWHQRCKGDEVRATVAEICFTSGTCWVEYNLPTGKRRSLLRLQELFQRNQTFEENLSDEFFEEERDPCDAFEPMAMVYEYEEVLARSKDKREQLWKKQQEELVQLESSEREAERVRRQNVQQERLLLHQEQREQCSSLLNTHATTLWDTVAGIKTEMEDLKKQLLASHWDEEVGLHRYEDLVQGQEKIDRARKDFEQEQQASHRRLIKLAQDLSREEAEEIICEETLRLEEEHEIHAERVVVLHKDYLEHFDTDELLYWTSRSCIPLNEIDFFMATEGGITLKLIGGRKMTLDNISDQAKWLNALKPLLKENQDKEVATGNDDPEVQPPSKSRINRAIGVVHQASVWVANKIGNPFGGGATKPNKGQLQEEKKEEKEEDKKEEESSPRQDGRVPNSF